MNANKQVFLFTLFSVGILLALGLFADRMQAFFPQVNNVNILAAITRQPREAPASLGKTKPAAFPNPDSIGTGAAGGSLFHYQQYADAGRVIGFSTDSSAAALPRTMQKLIAIRNGDQRKVRIAWLGDSMIEGDLATQDVRKQLQRLFGGGRGVGFVPIRAVTENLRATVSVRHSDSWDEANFKSNDRSLPLFLSGHAFQTGEGSIRISDNTAPDSGQVLEKYLLCGPSPDSFSLRVNGQARSFRAPNNFNRILLDKSQTRSIDLAFAGKPFPIYGVSIEPERGVVLDNLSFRGITGVELKGIPDPLLDALAREEYYDLIVLQYGVNLLFRANDKDFSYYKKLMSPVLKKLKEKLPNTELLLVSCSDRAFRYNNTWQTAIGIDSLIATQARLAFDHQIAFLNLYATMGGAGSIVRWADSATRLANKDYIHPNHRGAAILGDYLFDAIIADYHKAERPSSARISIQ